MEISLSEPVLLLKEDGILFELPNLNVTEIVFGISNEEGTQYFCQYGEEYYKLINNIWMQVTEEYKTYINNIIN